MQRFEGRVAIVTGGATGIGGGIARRLAAEGARVAIADIDVPTAEHNAQRIRDAGGEAIVIGTDVAQGDQIAAMVTATVARWDRLDVLVNNAFPALAPFPGSAEEVSEIDFRRGMDVLIGAVFLGAKHAVPAMRTGGGGQIVNLSSVHGLLAAEGAFTYETGKAAVIGATRQLAVEYGPDNIRVNAIAPGHIVTENIQSGLWDDNPSGRAFIEDQYPLRRAGTPDDIAGAAAFLCSDDAAFITGQTLVVDGGLSIQLQENFGIRQAAYLRAHPETALPGEA